MDYKQTTYRECYYALKEFLKAISSQSSAYLEGTLVDEYDRLVNDANGTGANTLISFDKSLYFSHDNGVHNKYYKRDGILAHIARNIARSRSQLDNHTDTVVIIEKSFDFIEDDDVRKILERDYREIQKGIISENWKSVIILCGGAIEAILLDLLSQHSSVALASQMAPGETDLNKWDLNNLVDVAVQEQLISSDVAKLSHTVREYRNLIHPGVEIRKNLKIEPEEAKIALEVLHILIRELSS